MFQLDIDGFLYSSPKLSIIPVQHMNIITLCWKCSFFKCRGTAERDGSLVLSHKFEPCREVVLSHRCKNLCTLYCTGLYKQTS